MSEDHVLHLGDCLDPLRGLATLADKSVDHVLCDPPYDEHTHTRQRRGATGRDKRFGFTGETISMERHVGFGFITEHDMAAVAAHAARLARRWVVIFCGMEQQADWLAAVTSAGLDHVRFGIWVKPGSTPQFTGDRPGTGCEAIEVAHQPGAKRWNGGGGFGLWTEPIVKHQTGERLHPTQKPLALMESLIADFTDPGDLILDPFAGSGTTLVAAKRLGRKAIGWEKDATFWELAVRRLENTRQQYELLPRGPKPKQQKMVLP